jgi:potassium-dependent mechanosensitive channel
MTRVARRLLALAAAFLCLVLLSVAAQAFDEKTVSSAERSAQLLQAQLRATQSAVQALNQPPDEEITKQRVKLSSLRNAAAAGSEKIKVPLADITSQVTELGPLPAAGQTETPTIAEQRQLLTAQMARLTAVQKQYTLLGLEAEQVEARLATTQREQFLQRIFQSGRSILDPRLWIETVSNTSLLWDKVAEQFRLGLAFASAGMNLQALWIFPAGLLALWSLISLGLPRLWSRTSLGRLMAAVPEGEAESGLLRLWRVLWGLLKLLLYFFAGLLLLAISLTAAGLINPQTTPLGEALVAAFEPAIIEGGLAWLVLSPTRRERRLVAVDGKSARILTLIIFLAALIYGHGAQISTLAAHFNLPVSLTVGQSAFTALALIILLSLALIIVRRQAAAGLGNAEVPYFLTWFLQLLPILWMLLAVAAMALVFGFIALSYFIVGNLLDSAMLLVFFGVAHAFCEALATALTDPATDAGRIIRRATGWGDAAVARLVLVFRTLSDVLLAVSAILALVALWTVVLFNFGSVLSVASQGIKIGNFTLSLGTLAGALLLLAVGIFITRYVTRWLDRRVLAQTNLDTGVQNSLRAGAGYTGYILAVIIALSAAGVEFSNLAIVAGALGVGIGFGLQSIVNNFVSGLILLAERPVRVGDWVVLPSGEGVIKKINVRSTEIETFDNCTIIVPNSSLITEPVRNWTHRDSVGRFTVTVALTHGINAEEAAKSLLKLAQDHPKVMRHPPPTVHLSQITPAAMVFDLRGHTRDVFESINIASDLRMALTQLFNKSQLQPQLPTPAPYVEPSK